MEPTEITVLYQEGDGQRHDDGSPKQARKARIVWDEATRKVFSSVIAEACSQTVTLMLKGLGVDMTTHARHHAELPDIIEWVHADIELKRKRKEFIERVLQDRFLIPAITAIGWLFIVAAALGMGKALGLWKFIAEVAL